MSNSYSRIFDPRQLRANPARIATLLRRTKAAPSLSFPAIAHASAFARFQTDAPPPWALAAAAIPSVSASFTNAAYEIMAFGRAPRR